MIPWASVWAALRWLGARLTGGPSARQRLLEEARQEVALERDELAAAGAHLDYYRAALDDLGQRVAALTERLVGAEERELAAGRAHLDCERRLQLVERRADTALAEAERGRSTIDRLGAQIRELAEALARARRLTPTSEHSAITGADDPTTTPPAGSRLIPALAPAGAVGAESLTPPFGDDTPT